MQSDIRVVIDTNVVISSLWGETPYQVLRLWQDGKYRIVVSDEILAEYEIVLRRFKPHEDDISEMLALFSDSRNTFFVIPKIKHCVVKNDQKDNMFIDCAVAGNASYIISGDKHLLRLKTFQDIHIITPAQCVELFD